MVEKTLTAISSGGIYDHLGGGVHRYATDRQWRVPHFEKMLYDQAILSRAYLEAYQATGKDEYAGCARDILEYVLRVLRHEKGAFYSAQDADSFSQENDEDKKEGAFYVWKEQEIIDALGVEQAKVFGYVFGVKTSGNVKSDPQGEFKGKNILYRAHTLEEAAEFFKKPPDEISRIIAESKKKLNRRRQGRPKPHLDDKILVDWNGLMISSFALGSRVLNEPRYSKAAEQAAEFIKLKLKNKKGRLLHCYRKDEAAIPAMIEDYAFFIQGLLDLYESTFKAEYLVLAQDLTNEMLKLFWDNEGRGFFFTGNDAPQLIARRKEIYDGAIPSGNSIAALCLIRMGRLIRNDDLAEKSKELIKAFSKEISVMPDGYSQMLTALDFILGPLKEIIIVGRRRSDSNSRIVQAVFKVFLPNKIVLFRTADEKESKGIINALPFMKDYFMIDNKTTAYLCSNNICIAPAVSAEKLEELLK